MGIYRKKQILFRCVSLLLCLSLCFCEQWKKSKDEEKKANNKADSSRLNLLIYLQLLAKNPIPLILSCVTHESQYYTIDCVEAIQNATDPCKRYQALGVEVFSSVKSCTDLGFNFKSYRVVKCYYNNYSISIEASEKCSAVVMENAVASKFSIVLDNNALPTVSSTKPVDEFTLISKDDLVNIVFSERINSNTLTSSNITTNVAGNPVTLTILTGSNFVNLLPNPAGNSWLTGQVYTVTISGNIEDEYGNKMNLNYTFNFQAN